MPQLLVRAPAVHLDTITQNGGNASSPTGWRTSRHVIWASEGHRMPPERPVCSCATATHPSSYFSMSTRMNGAGRVGWSAGPFTRTVSSKVTMPVAVAGRSFLVLSGPLTVVLIGPTAVQVTSKVTW